MRQKFIRRFAPHREILVNATSIVGTTAVTSAFGSVYWLVAARRFPEQAVGLAAAAIAAMSLLGTVGMLGLGTLLVGEFPRRPGEETSLLSTALLTAGVLGAALGIAFALLAGRISPELQPLSSGAGTVLLFGIGVSLTASTLVLDTALIGLLRGGLQFERNLAFAATKLAALFPVALWWTSNLGIAILATWIAGVGLSLVGLGWRVARGRRGVDAYLPRIDLLRRLGGAAVRHHLLNLSLQTPGLVLPLLVTIMLSVETNAAFYVAFMLAGFVFVGPRSLTNVLYATAAKDPATLPQKIRFTLGLAVLIGLAPNVVLQSGAEPILRFFGSRYAEAAWPLRCLCLAVFPLIVKDHFVAVCRIQNRVAAAARVAALGGSVEITLAAVGALAGGLLGLTTGWLIGVCFEAALMARTVRQVAAPADEAR